MKIAIFGGSFNPAHFAHYEIVRQLNHFMEFDKIIIVPAFKNPLKEDLPSIPEEVRLKMLEETFSEFTNVEISQFELSQQKTSFTHTTLEHFKGLYPDHQCYLILGEDALASFHLWAKADRITELCELLAFHRPAGGRLINTSAFDRYGCTARWMKARIPDISATEIRTSSLETVKRNRWLHPHAYKTWEQFITIKHKTLSK
jgi:nicotinate-nucleotide adenylyltransferase